MDDAEVVRGLEGIRRLAEDVGGACQRQRALALEQIGEWLALDELHGEVDQPVARFAEIVDGADVGVRDAAGVRGFAIEPRDRVGIVHHRRVHHLDRAAPPHLHVLGQIHLAHAAFTELLHDVIAVRPTLPHESVRRRRGAQRLAIVGTELHIVGVLGGADGTDLHAAAPPSGAALPGSSTRSSLSPIMMREPWRSSMAPRAATATPLRLWSSTSTKSASSERTVACCALIDGSDGKIQSPRSRPMCTSRPGDSWMTSRELPSLRSCVRLAMSALGTMLPNRLVAS